MFEEVNAKWQAWEETYSARVKPHSSGEGMGWAELH